LEQNFIGMAGALLPYDNLPARRLHAHARVMRPSQIAEVIDREFRAAVLGVHTPAMLWGPPGVGKSQIGDGSSFSVDRMTVASHVRTQANEGGGP
jgi:replication-associated recombination protein RarA